MSATSLDINDIFISHSGGNNNMKTNATSDEINNLINMLTSEKVNNNFDTVTSITNTHTLEAELKKLLSDG